MKLLNVHLPGKTYPLYIATEGLQKLPELMSQFHLTEGKYIITDSHVGPLYIPFVKGLFEKEGISIEIFQLPAGEPSKSLAVCEEIYTGLLKKNASRGSVILAFGGGVIGDLAGFVAATFMRGIRLVQIPTTLLAQVDSSIGGKVGVNHPLGKNIIGTFYHPEFVLIDPTMLRTLPVRELRAGLAEVVKVALIQDAHLFVILQKNITGAIRLDDFELITGLIHDSCAIKARIVKKDEREKGIRVILNFGHTIGHALEAATHYEYFRHGEAVTLGMAAAVNISTECGYLQAGAAEPIWQLLRHLQAPDIPADLTAHDVMSYLQYDKKRLSTGQRWVLLNHIGSAIVVSNIPEGVIHHAIEFLFDFNARP